MSIPNKVNPVPSVWDGFDFILNHFSADNSLEPRTMSTKLTDNCQISLRHDEIPSEFYRADFLDCKVAAYPSFKKQIYKDPRDCYVRKCSGVVPDFLFIDPDKGKFNGQMALLNEVLKFTLRNINENFMEDSSLQSYGQAMVTISICQSNYHCMGDDTAIGFVDQKYIFYDKYRVIAPEFSKIISKPLPSFHYDFP